MERKSGGDRAESKNIWIDDDDDDDDDGWDSPARFKAKPRSAAPAVDSMSRLCFSKRKAPTLLSMCLGMVGKHFEDFMLDLGDIAVNFPSEIKMAMIAIARRRKLLTDDVLISLIDPSSSWEILDLCGSDISDIGLTRVAEICKYLRALDISGCLRSDKTMSRCLDILKPQLTLVEEDSWEDINTMEDTQGAQTLRWIVWPTIDSESLACLWTQCPRITVNPSLSTSVLRENRFPNEVLPDVALDNFAVKDIDPRAWSAWGHVPRAEPSPTSNPNELSIAEKFRLAFAERDARLAPKRAKNARQHLRRSRREWMMETDAKARALASQLSRTFNM